MTVRNRVRSQHSIQNHTDQGLGTYQLRSPAIQVAEVHLHGVPIFDWVVHHQNEPAIWSVQTVDSEEPVPPSQPLGPTPLGPSATHPSLVTGGNGPYFRSRRPGSEITYVWKGSSAEHPTPVSGSLSLRTSVPPRDRATFVKVKVYQASSIPQVIGEVEVGVQSLASHLEPHASRRGI